MSGYVTPAAISKICAVNTYIFFLSGFFKGEGEIALVVQETYCLGLFFVVIYISNISVLIFRIDILCNKMHIKRYVLCIHEMFRCVYFFFRSFIKWKFPLRFCIFHFIFSCCTPRAHRLYTPSIPAYTVTRRCSQMRTNIRMPSCSPCHKLQHRQAISPLDGAYRGARLYNLVIISELNVGW